MYTSMPDHSEIYFHTPTPLARNFLYPLCLGHFLCDETYRVSRNSYDSYLIMYIKKGGGYFYSHDAKISLRPGQITLIDCYQPHIYGASSCLDFYWIHFDGPSASGYVQYLFEHCKFPFSLNSLQALEAEQLFSLLLNGFSQGNLPELKLAKYITDLLALLTDGADSGFTAGAADSARLCQKACAFMQQNVSRPLTLKDITSQVGLSPYHFIRCFKQQYGMPPHRYLSELRLNSACFYLGTTDKTIREIAFLCGFQSENNFCIAFKKHLRMTPSDYRRSVSHTPEGQ